MIRFLAFYEDRVALARTTEVSHPAIYSAYRALLERTPRPRNKMTPFRTNYELFSVTIVSIPLPRAIPCIHGAREGQPGQILGKRWQENV